VIISSAPDGCKMPECVQLKHKIYIAIKNTYSDILQSYGTLEIINITSSGFKYAIWKFVCILFVFLVEHSDDGSRGDRNIKEG